MIVAGARRRIMSAQERSASEGEYPTNKPVTPTDITKTVYRAMGIHNLEAIDNQNRPYNLQEEGTAIGELF